MFTMILFSLVLIITGLMLLYVSDRSRQLTCRCGISSFLLNRGVPPRAPKIRSEPLRSKRIGIYEGLREFPISPCRTRHSRPARTHHIRKKKKGSMVSRKKGKSSYCYRVISTGGGEVTSRSTEVTCTSKIGQ